MRLNLNEFIAAVNRAYTYAYTDTLHPQLHPELVGDGVLETQRNLSLHPMIANPLDSARKIVYSYLSHVELDNVKDYPILCNLAHGFALAAYEIGKDEAIVNARTNLLSPEGDLRVCTSRISTDTTRPNVATLSSKIADHSTDTHLFKTTILMNRGLAQDFSNGYQLSFYGTELVGELQKYITSYAASLHAVDGRMGLHLPNIRVRQGAPQIGAALGEQAAHQALRFNR